MKTLKLVPLCLVAFIFCTFSVTAQDDDDFEDELFTITGVYEGIEDSMFVFTYEDEDGEENTISIDKISPEVKKAYDLFSKKLIGKSFEITYSNENIEDEDDEDILTSVKTIVTLKQL